MWTISLILTVLWMMGALSAHILGVIWTGHVTADSVRAERPWPLPPSVRTGEIHDCR